MSDAKPPERPPAAAQAKRNWAERFVALGNDHKVIAVATALTIITGVSFLVSNAVRGVAGDDGPDVLLTERFLADLAVAADAARQRVDAEAVPVEGDGGGERGARGGSAVVRGGREAVDALAQAARRPEATEAERAALMQALLDHGAGKPAAALRELERIARTQEVRGALADAAATWRHRAYLQTWTDPAGAVADYQRAESLAPADARAQLAYAEMLGETFRMKDSVNAARRARDAARAEGDDRTLAGALQLLAFPRVGAWRDEPEYLAEVAAARGEVLGLLRGFLEEEGPSPDLVGDLVELLIGESRVETFDAVAAELDALVERVEALPATGEGAQDRALMAALAWDGVADLRRWRGPADESAEALAEHRRSVVVASRRALEALDGLPEPSQLDVPALSTAYWIHVWAAGRLQTVEDYDSAPPVARAGLDLGALLAARMPDGGEARGKGVTVVAGARSLIQLGRFDEAREWLEEHRGLDSLPEYVEYRMGRNLEARPVRAAPWGPATTFAQAYYLNLGKLAAEAGDPRADWYLGIAERILASEYCRELPAAGEWPSRGEFEARIAELRALIGKGNDDE